MAEITITGNAQRDSEMCRVIPALCNSPLPISNNYNYNYNTPNQTDFLTSFASSLGISSTTLVFIGAGLLILLLKKK